MWEQQTDPSFPWARKAEPAVLAAEKLNKVGTTHEPLSNSSVDMPPLAINPLSITGAVLYKQSRQAYRNICQAGSVGRVYNPEYPGNKQIPSAGNKAGSFPPCALFWRQGGSRRAPVPFIAPGWPKPALQAFLNSFHLKIISVSCPCCAVWKVIPGYNSILVWGFFSLNLSMATLTLLQHYPLT